MSHIANRDILIGTIAATIAGAISYLGYAARFGVGDRCNSKQWQNIIFFPGSNDCGSIGSFSYSNGHFPNQGIQGR